jgi:poly(3-hydroxybutyrate) depolymerase
VQGAEFIEDRFATQSGFNEWGESNNLVIVYPQVEKSLFNPKGCWDWWGYTDDDYDLRAGKQVAGVLALIDSYVSGTLVP